MKILVVVALAALLAVFQNCSQGGSISGGTTDSKQQSHDTDTSSPEPVDTTLCAGFASPQDCANALGFSLVTGEFYSLIDTSLANLQAGTVKTTQVAMQPYSSGSATTEGILFKLRIITTVQSPEIANLQVQCYLDNVTTGLACGPDQISVPVLTDDSFRTFSVVVTSAQYGFSKSLSIKVGRILRIDSTASSASVSGNQVYVPAGSVMRFNGATPYVQVGEDAALLYSAKPRNVTIRLDKNAQLTVTNQTNDPNTIFELKENSRSYFQGELSYATIRARPGALIFSDSAVRYNKLELLP